VLRGWARARLGSPAEGEAEIRGAIQLSEGIGIKLIRPNFLALQAEAQLLGGDGAGALVTLAEAAQVADRTEERCYLPQILSLRAAASA
jgi:hypothetical protein